MKGQKIVMKEVRHINELDMQFIHDGHDSRVNERCCEVKREY